jgi:hypothetical protein
VNTIEADGQFVVGTSCRRSSQTERKVTDDTSHRVRVSSASPLAAAAWHADIAIGVRHMQHQEKTPAAIDPDRAAAALLAGIQGGVAIMLATWDLSYLEAALDTGLHSLRLAGWVPAHVPCARRRHAPEH